MNLSVVGSDVVKSGKTVLSITRNTCKYLKRNNNFLFCVCWCACVCTCGRCWCLPVFLGSLVVETESGALQFIRTR